MRRVGVQIFLCFQGRKAWGMKETFVKYGQSEAPRPPRHDGTGTAGLPGEELSFILCPSTPPIGRGLRGTFRPRINGLLPK